MPPRPVPVAPDRYEAPAGGGFRSPERLPDGTARDPRETERRRPARERLERERERLERERERAHRHFTAHPDDAGRFLRRGQYEPGEGVAEIDLAAHTVVASLLLNLDEAITHE